MRCPVCDAPETRVIETRSVDEGSELQEARVPGCQTVLPLTRFEENYPGWSRRTGAGRLLTEKLMKAPEHVKSLRSRLRG